MGKIPGGVDRAWLTPAYQESWSRSPGHVSASASGFRGKQSPTWTPKLPLVGDAEGCIG